MNTKKSMMIIICLISVVLIVCVLTMPNMKQANAEYMNTDFYYLESQSTLMKTESKNIIKDDDYIEVIKNVVLELKIGPKTEGLLGTVPSNVDLIDVTYDESKKSVLLDFSSEYKEMKAGEEVQCRTSLVWTLTSLDFVNDVLIAVDGVEIEKTNGETVGTLNRDNVVIDNVVSTEPSTRSTIMLYFSDDQAEDFSVELRKIDVNPNEPIEKYVIEQLIAGPLEENSFATMPSETKLKSIKTDDDGICYVDLNSSFIDKHSGGSAGVYFTIYSIVNSLTDLSHINRVQFLVEGEKVTNFKDHMDLGMPISRLGE